MTVALALSAVGPLDQFLAAGKMTSIELATPRVDWVDPLSDSEWDRQVASHPRCTIFHGSAWARVLVRTYGHTPFYMRLWRGDQLIALVPLIEVRSRVTGCRGVSLPFTDVCEPLLFADDALESVHEQLLTLARSRNWRHFEVRGGAFSNAATPSLAFYSHTLDLRAGLDRLFTGFESSVRRAIRKGEKSNFVIEIVQSREAVLQFYQLHMQTRRRHGVPPQPLSFFLNIHREMLAPGLGFIVLAHNGSQPAAGAVFFQFGSTAVYKFGASDESLQELRGNNMVMSRAIRHLAENRAETLHFGRTSLFNEGLRRFKRSWGANEERIEYFRFDVATETYVTSRDNASGLHTALFSRLPVVVNRIAGSLLYPHLD